MELTKRNIIKVLFFFLLLTVSSCTMSNLDLSVEGNRFSELLEIVKTIESPEGLRFLQSQTNSCDVRSDSKDPDFYYFLPTMKAILKAENDWQSFKTNCFEENTITLQKLSKEKTVLTLASSKPTSSLCNDKYWIATSNIHSIKTQFFHGEHTITLTNLNDEDLLEISVSGLRVMSFCQDVFPFVQSLVKTLKLYIGGFGDNPDAWLPIMRPSLPDSMYQANLDFVNRFTHFAPLHRGAYADIITDIDESFIKSGDYIGIYRLDGLDPLIMLGTGARTGHTAVACRYEGELYILESQDGWYWPRHGIQKNKYRDWVKWAHAAHFSVVHLPLREEYRQKFDVEKALKWYHSGIEGLNYGYHNFLFSWIDTPDKNFPSMIEPTIFLPLFSVVEKIARSATDLILGEALNFRLGTKGLSIHQAVVEASKNKQTFEDILAMNELDTWEYSDGKNFVCSCFVIAFWKAGGIFDGYEILPNEFSPKDVYQIDIFDKNIDRPQVCKDADPDLPYCQIMGRYNMELKGYSSIEIYSHMNEKCPSQAPNFERPNGC
jgi:hypothetical protein